MKIKATSIAQLIAGILLAVITTTLILFSIFDYYSERIQAIRNLSDQLEISTIQVASGLVLPIWNVDTPQIISNIESLMRDERIASISLSTPERNYFFSRDKSGKTVQTEIAVTPESNTISLTKPITFADRTIATISVNASMHILEQQLKVSILQNIIRLIFFDLILVSILFISLRIFVINPLKSLESYVISVSTESVTNTIESPRTKFVGEMQTLHDSFDSMLDLLSSRYLQIQASEERLRLFFERQLMGMAITSPEKGWLQVNARLCEMLAYSEEELMQKNWAELTHPEDLAPDVAQFERLLKREIEDYTIKKRFVRKDGEVVYTNLAVACVRKSDGSVDYVLALLEDITDRMLAERALIESEERFRSLSEGAFEGILIHDKGLILAANQKMAELFEFKSVKEMVGQNAFQICPLTEQSRNYLITRSKERDSSVGEIEVIRKDGTTYPAETQGRDVSFMGRNARVVVMRDITERKQAELELEKHKNKLEELVHERTLDLMDTIQRLKETQSQLVQSEKLASLGVLTAGVAHEINNPINYINSSIVALNMLAIELIDVLKVYETVTAENINEKLEEIKGLKEQINLSETIEGVSVLTNNIKAGAKKTADIVKSLRIFSRMDSDEQALADINENIDSTLILLHNQYKDRIEIIKNYGTLPRVNCFAGKLNQVFMNLLANAIHAIEENGTITIKTQYFQSGVSEFQKECILISISDTGSGIASDIKNKVFEPFFTTKEIGKGTGLGLSISYGIIEQHKGKMEFTSVVGKGTEFAIYLPTNH